MEPCRVRLIAGLYNKVFYILKKDVAIVRMDIYTNRFAEVQAEDAHNGFCVNDIAARCQIHVKVEFVDNVDEVLDVIDRPEHNIERFHKHASLANIQLE